MSRLGQHNAAYVLEVDVVEVVLCAYALDEPALGRVDAQRQDGLVRQVGEDSVWPARQLVTHVEGHTWLQHVAVEAANVMVPCTHMCTKIRCRWL